MFKLNEDKRDRELSFEGEKIIIEPKSFLESLIAFAKEKGHKSLKQNYYNNDDFFTTIIADYSGKIIKFQNLTDNSIYTAFGIKSSVSWDDYNYFEERCVPKDKWDLKTICIQ